MWFAAVITQGKIVKKKLSSAWLQRSTLHYVQRYPASVRRVRQVMVRRIDRKLRDHPGERATLLDQLDELIESLQRGGHLDDLRQAGLWLDAWHRKGMSLRGMRAKLVQMGLDSQMAEEALRSFREQAVEEAAANGSDSVTGSSTDLDMEAAENYARRRRLGPYRRDPSQGSERRQRDLASLARQGFSFDVASRVLDGDQSV